MDLRDELLDRCYQASDSFDRYVLEHARIVGDKKALTLATEISDKLGELYQLAGGVACIDDKDYKTSQMDRAYVDLLENWPHEVVFSDGDNQSKCVSKKVESYASCDIVETFFGPSVKNTLLNISPSTELFKSAIETLTDDNPIAGNIGRAFGNLRDKVVNGKQLIREVVDCQHRWRVVVAGTVTT